MKQSMRTESGTIEVEEVFHSIKNPRKVVEVKVPKSKEQVLAEIRKALPADMDNKA